MKPFIHDDFRLETDVARDLYHRHMKDLPIVDHYKWRAMRANGVGERYCTGEASDWEKFEAWAKTFPATLRNPLYHWTHMELRRPFGMTELHDR